MSLKSLIGKSINEFGEMDSRCLCGRRHKSETKFFISEGAEEKAADAVQTVVPAGCGLILLKQDGFDVADLSRNLRRAGYKVYERTVAVGDGCGELRRLKPQDDVRMVLGVGGGFVADCAKYAAAQNALPSGMIVRVHSSPSFLVPSAALTEESVPRLFKTDSPKMLLCDTALLNNGSDINAAAFGSVVSRLVALFDWKFASVVRNEVFCPEIYEAALGEIDFVLSRLRGISRYDRAVGKILLESGLKLSALCAMSGSSRLFSGGDTACALALKMLQTHESRPSRLQGENEFLFSLLLTEIYPKMFAARKEKGFLPPPDNNMRLERLKEYFGMSEHAAAGNITEYPSDEKMKLYDYRIGEYEQELSGELMRLKTRLTDAYRIFRRLHGDDGYFIKSYMDVSEARLCLALAPEMRNKYTALTHLKNMGVTDAYLLD